MSGVVYLRNVPDFTTEGKFKEVNTLFDDFRG
jgi:hypothetical protein